MVEAMGVNDVRIRRRRDITGGCAGHSRPGRRRRNAEVERDDGKRERETADASWNWKERERIWRWEAEALNILLGVADSEEKPMRAILAIENCMSHSTRNPLEETIPTRWEIRRPRKFQVTWTCSTTWNQPSYLGENYIPKLKVEGAASLAPPGRHGGGHPSRPARCES